MYDEYVNKNKMRNIWSNLDDYLLECTKFFNILKNSKEPQNKSFTTDESTQSYFYSCFQIMQMIIIHNGGKPEKCWAHQFFDVELYPLKVCHYPIKMLIIVDKT